MAKPLRNLIYDSLDEGTSTVCWDLSSLVADWCFEAGSSVGIARLAITSSGRKNMTQLDNQSKSFERAFSLDDHRHSCKGECDFRWAILIHISSPSSQTRVFLARILCLYD